MSNGTRKPEWEDPSEITVGEAGSAGYATRAGYATSAGSAGYATNAANANYASTAGYAERAGSAIFPQNFVAVMYGNNPPESTGWTSITWTGIPSGCTAWVKGTIPTKYIEFISETADGVNWQGNNPVYIGSETSYTEWIKIQQYSGNLNYTKIESNRPSINLNNVKICVLKGTDSLIDQRLDISWSAATAFPIIITPYRLDSTAEIYRGTTAQEYFELHNNWQMPDIESISINDFGANIFSATQLADLGGRWAIVWNNASHSPNHQCYYIQITAATGDGDITGYAVIDLS